VSGAAALFESVAVIARHEASARAITSAGRVVDIFPSEGQPDHAVSVELRDSGLVLPRVPVAVGAMGFAAIPAVGDLVVVAFLEGDYSAPVVVGRLYHPDQNPPTHKEGELVLRLPSGEADPALNLEISTQGKSIKLSLPGDLLVELVEGRVLIQVGGSDGLRVAVQESGGGRVEVAAGSAKLTLKKDGDITVASQGKLKLEGSDVEISATAKVKVSGAQVEIN
jgi:uncharacterized protein involved in type VI secretion and phage assembly